MADSVTLTYDPFLLPTAQHRAGLAGLLVLRESLRRRGIGPLPGWEPCPDGRVAITLTSASLQVLMDDLYDGVWEERVSDAPPKGQSARAITPVQVAVTEQGKERQKTRYRFQDYAIKAGFYEPFSMPAMWVKLWREAVWATLRGRPTTRGVYKDRADGKPASTAGELWKALAPPRARGGIPSLHLSSSIFVGAQDRTAEDVPFLGRPDETLLLHFWPVVALVGEAWRPVLKPRNEDDEEPLGYVFAVPDVADLSGFLEDFPHMVAELGDEAYRYRPRDAVLSVPHEGALEYLHHVARLAQAKGQVSALAYSISGVEIFQLLKRGNNIDLRASARVAADHALVDRYDTIRGRCRHPFFRAQLIRNLLDERPWYHGFDRLFAVHDRKHFVGAAARRFVADAYQRLGAAPSDSWGPGGVALLEDRT